MIHRSDVAQDGQHLGGGQLKESGIGCRQTDLVLGFSGGATLCLIMRSLL